jgi:hypothetical protein
MRHVAFYHLETGLFHPNGITLVVSDDLALPKNTPEDYSAIDQPKDGCWDHLSQRVDMDKIRAEEDAAATAWAAQKETNRLKRAAGVEVEDPLAPARTIAGARHIVDYQPPAPSHEHEWDATTKRWHLSAAARQKNANRVMANHLRSKQHDWVRILILDPGNAEARARLEALHQQITALEGGTK